MCCVWSTVSHYLVQPFRNKYLDPRMTGAGCWLCFVRRKVKESNILIFLNHQPRAINSYSNHKISAQPWDCLTFFYEKSFIAPQAIGIRKWQEGMEEVFWGGLLQIWKCLEECSKVFHSWVDLAVLFMIEETMLRGQGELSRLYWKAIAVSSFAEHPRSKRN